MALTIGAGPGRPAARLSRSQQPVWPNRLRAGSSSGKKRYISPLCSSWSVSSTARTGAKALPFHCSHSRRVLSFAWLSTLK